MNSAGLSLDAKLSIQDKKREEEADRKKISEIEK